MFSYISLLIEQEFFDVINVNFLIVGHTHASIDQFFSVLGRAISRSAFIGYRIFLHRYNIDYLTNLINMICLGSPLSLINLFKEETKETYNILVARQISVYYDFSEAISTIVNKEIKVMIFLILLWLKLDQKIMDLT